MTDDNKQIFKFEGKKTTVTWDGRLCIHIAECGQANNELFVMGRNPWCQPDLVSQKELSEVVSRCPTGALNYESTDGELKETVDTINTVTIANNGPLYVKGNLKIQNAQADMPGVKKRAALCRCGHSKNKPFCDSSHEEFGFKDHGAVGKQGDEEFLTGGDLHVDLVPDGPLMFKGNFEIQSASGRVAWHGTQAAFCRCGKSKNKPFCDGSHAQNDFKAD